jgi:RNA polymerase sigma-70 factor (ECF subfamily)
MDEQQEYTIIQKLKAGDIHALTPLVRAYQHRALRTAYLVTQNQEMAEDVTQSAFLRAYDKIHQFDTSRRFLPWFLRIVVNMAIQTAKKQSRTFSLDAFSNTDDDWLPGDLLADTVPSPETQLEMQELQQQIEALLQQLSPEKRAVIVLRYYVDCTESEMADLLDVPGGTIKSRLFAARKQLRRLISALF